MREPRPDEAPTDRAEYYADMSLGTVSDDADSLDASVETRVKASEGIVVCVATLPSAAVARTRWWPIVESQAADPSRISESLQGRLDLIRAGALSTQDQQSIEHVNQYLRYAYTHHADIVVIDGEGIPASAVDVIGRFSARLTVICEIAGDIEPFVTHFRDTRKIRGSTRVGILMSPYSNVLFDLETPQVFPSLDASLTRNGRADPEIDLIFDGRGSLTVRSGISDYSISLARPHSPPRLAFFLSSETGLVQHGTSPVLYEGLDRHADEFRSGLANLAKSRDPEAYLLQIAESFEHADLSIREQALLDDILDSFWRDRSPNTRWWDPLILASGIQGPQQVRYQALDSSLPEINAAIVRARSIGDEELAQSLEELWLRTSAEMHELEDVPERVRRIADRYPAIDEHTGEHPIFAGRLGSFSNEDLERALERQARLLTVINRLTKLDVELKYIVYTRPTRAGHLVPSVEVLCTVKGCSELEAASLRADLGEFIHSAFVGLYGLSFSFERGTLIRDPSTCRFRARILPGSPGDELVRISSFPDWAFALDYMCSMERPAYLVMSVSRGGSLSPTLDSSDRGGAIVGEDDEMESMLSRIARRVGVERQYLNLTISLASDDPLPTPLIEMICAEVGGDLECSFEEVDIDTIPGTKVSLMNTLRVFHPPFGNWYLSTMASSALSIPSPVDEFPIGGLPLGIALRKHAKADSEVEVRLPDKDRLRHIYLIGRTGSGKTNMLRGLVASELSSPGTGLAVIDPHGDLANHLLNLIPKSRFADLQIVDFSDPDLTPVLNPLLIDRSSRLLRSRLAQEVLGLLKLRVFHEFSGPRFDEIVRLLLDTLLDDGYPVTPSLVDASLILTDERVQKRVRETLNDSELKARWSFHDKLKRENDYFNLLDWAVSKLDDIAHDDTLRSMLGGSRNTVDIEAVVRANGILVVSVPESIVGRDTAEFIGSLVLLQLKTALMRRVAGQTEPFFVYVDEFQKFAGVGFEELLAEARKFSVGLVMAHQNMEQLRSFSQHTGTSTHALVNSILGNVGTMVVFPIGAQDAELLSGQLGVSKEQIARIARYEALIKMTAEGHQIPSFTLRTRYAEPGMDPRRIDDMREFFARGGLMARRSDVSLEIDRRRALLQAAAKSATGGESQSNPEQPAGVSAGTQTPGFLDGWLAKRKAVEEVPDQPVSFHRGVGPLPVGAQRRQNAEEAVSWASLVGPVMKLEDVAKYLQRSEARLLADAARGRLLVLTTRRGTKVVPASHFDGGAVLPGLARVTQALLDAPFGQWTKAGWLATPNLGLGQVSPIEFIRSGGDDGLLDAIVEAYAEVM